MLEIVQIIFFTVSTIGVVIATFNHFWFVRDRSLKNLLDVSMFMQNAKQQYSSAKASKTLTPLNIAEHVNALTVYCHFHNNNYLNKMQKSVHQKYVANNIQTALKNHPKRFLKGKKAIIIFIERNGDLFDDPSDLLAAFES